MSWLKILALNYWKLIGAIDNYSNNLFLCHSIIGHSDLLTDSMCPRWICATLRVTFLVTKVSPEKKKTKLNSKIIDS